MRYKLVIAYNGARFCGWQVQKSALSIQGLVQKAVEIALRHSVTLPGSGRTDAGVHAQGQTAHFDTPSPIDPLRLRFTLHALLPPDIRILEVIEVPSDFHARFSASSKIYHYHLHLDPTPDPFSAPYRHIVRRTCDLDRMAKAIPYFIGTHNFTSFANSSTDGISPEEGIRTLYRLDLIEQKGGVRLEFEANGFLYRMARNITGALLAVAANKIEPEEMIPMREAQKRQNLFKPAPPQGLFLHEVCYESLRKR